MPVRVDVVRTLKQGVDHIRKKMKEMSENEGDSGVRRVMENGSSYSDLISHQLCSRRTSSCCCHLLLASRSRQPTLSSPFCLSRDRPSARFEVTPARIEVELHFCMFASRSRLKLASAFLIFFALTFL
ncbi:hypothetical protein VNO78_24123 [Psophocarpus tetragonolobus]|uniref:Uncharacterized protein n=1 Tax=Psophocarpus tetragonolobus TaxID=3891 RepID=A0AAN9S5N2_PSOTE